MSDIFSYSLVILLTISFFIIAYLSYKSNQKGKSNKIFSLITILIGLWNAFSFLTDEPFDLLVSGLFLKLDFAIAALIASLFLLFSLNFPRRNSILNRFKIEPPILILGIFFSLISLTNLVVTNIRYEEGFTQYDNGFLSNLYFIFTVVIFGWSIINLILKQKKLLGVERLQTRIVLLGLALSVTSAVFFDIVLPIINTNPPPVVTRLGIYGTSFLVGFTAYAIIKHRLLDIEVIIRRSLVYSTLLASIIVIYSVLIFGLNRIFVPSETISFPRVTDLIAIIVVAFTIDPLRKFIENITDKIFFKSRYDSEDTIKNISETISEVLDIEQLVNSLRLTLNKTIKINKIAVYVRTNHHFEPIDNLGGFDDRFDTTLEKKYFIGKYFKNNHKLVVAEELIREISEIGEHKEKDILQTVTFLRKNKVGVMMPLVVKGKLTGVIFLGDKLSGDPFSNEDLRLLEIFSRQASIALENARLYQEQKKFSEKLQKEVKQATTSLRTANEKLKELDRLKDEFVSVASHELRTPMTAIKSYVWLALDGKAGKITPKTKSYLDKVYLSSERMIKLINDMLNVSRIESGRLKLEIQPTSIFKVAESVFSDLSVKAEEEKIKLRIEKNHVIPQALVDPDKLSEIFTNLVGNSIKFTPENGTITISAQKEGTMLAISVTDTGTGISKENMTKLFSKFGRIEDSYATSNTSTGTGLGLFIIKNYIEKMNGKIWVNSELGKGTTFTFSLPTAKTKKK